MLDCLCPEYDEKLVFGQVTQMFAQYLQHSVMTIGAQELPDICSCFGTLNESRLTS